MALIKSKAVIIASTSNAAGATTRGRIDLSSASGGIITMKITNNATGPTLPCKCWVMISHEEALPALEAAGGNWKRVWPFSGTTVANAVTERSFEFGPEVRHIQVEFSENTAQAVTVEAIATTYAS